MKNGRLERALAMSKAVCEAAERGDARGAATLAAWRLRLLKSAMAEARPSGPQEQSLLDQIRALNDRAIGHLEHHWRIKGRQLDVAAAGRRAVSAYSTTRLPRC